MKKSKNSHSIDELLKIMDELRVKCPWDKEQTIDSLKTLTVEETFELVDAINDGDYDEIKNELGDLLLHIIFYSKIADEKQIFNFNDVVESISKKLIHRHPHVYKTKKQISKEEVKKNWEKLKINEGRDSILSGVPKTLPSLIKALRIQDKVSSAGFKWDSVVNSKNKVIEELYKDGITYIDVVTQGRNYSAQRLYQRCGFITQSTELWYHKWLKKIN